jgi:hypothetical protein
MVPVSELRKVFELLMQHVEETDGPVIELGKDYFWSIPMDELYNVYEKPSDLTIGQLSECLQHLEKMNEDPEWVISYGLVWLAEVLRAVSLSTGAV